MSKRPNGSSEKHFSVQRLDLELCMRPLVRWTVICTECPAGIPGMLEVMTLQSVVHFMTTHECPGTDVLV